jgi:PAS domain S-box-containing protein
MSVTSPFVGATEMAARMREFDWRRTPLGPVEDWPLALQTTVRVLLTSRFAMWMSWGPELTFLYNDAYALILGVKHPWALGRPSHEVWSEIWPDIGPRIHGVLRSGEASWDEALLLFLERSGEPEETYHTFSYSPLADDESVIRGHLCVVSEDTSQVIGERRLATLRDVAAALATVSTEDDLCTQLSASLQARPHDLPFTAMYLRDRSGASWQRLCVSGIAEQHAAVPERVTDDDSPWPLAAAAAGEMRIDRLDRRIADLPSGPWHSPPTAALLMPIAEHGVADAAGVFIAALNPYRPRDEDEATFVRLLVGQVAAALANVRSYEATRRRAEALAELDRQKSAFFSNISHEFRTPLTLMLGPTEDALATPERVLTGDVLDSVYRNQQRLLKLVNTLLDFSRLEAGRMVGSFEPTDLPRMTAELASTFRSAFERAGLTFAVVCEPIHDEVYVDRGIWEKVVLNLLSNALKFTFEGGVTVRLSSGPGQVTLAVEDTGIGIAAAHLPHLFERFYRVEGAKARTHEGSGIGLALVSDLVRLHGGTCGLESTTGVGTTVTITLPTGRGHLASSQVRETATEPPTSAAPNPFVLEALRWLPDEPGSGAEAPAGGARAPAAQVGPGAAAPAHVLVADDNADMRDYLVRLLSAHWSVAAAGNGEEALAAIARRRPDLVLTDVMMPGVDGFALLRALRAHPETATIPVVMLSARAGEEAVLEGVEAGADDYLVKPFSARELLARVGAQLRLAEAARDRAALLAREQRAREEAETQRRQLRAIFDQAPTLIAVFRGPDHVVELANEQICQGWGRRQEEVLGRPFFDAVPEGRDQSWRPLLDGVYHSGQAHVGRETAAQFVREGRLETRYFDFIWAPLRENGVVDGIIVVATDVTEQVLARHELSGLREAAESANRAKDEFLAMLGHELRNPLAPIMTALQLLKLRGVSGVDREREIIERQVHHLVSLVDDLLDVSRITRGKLELKRAHVELSDVVAKAIEMASPLLEQQRHQLWVDVARRGLGLWGDPTRLAQVVANVLNNAAKYTEPGGRIAIIAAREADQVVLCVQDSGVGIAAEMLPCVFDLFVQERQTSARSRGGLGLGLTIVRSLVTLHGGTVAADSEGPGRGSTFTIRLPYHAAPASSGAAADAPWPAAAEVGRARLRVLVVDDNADAAEMLAEMLAHFGYAVCAAHDGPAALEAASTFHPDAALLDIGLPVMDGYELARQLARHPALSGIRLVAVTGYGQRQDREQSAAAGFHAHLVKPLDATQLQEVLAGLQPLAAPRGDRPAGGPPAHP